MDALGRSHTDLLTWEYHYKYMTSIDFEVNGSDVKLSRKIAKGQCNNDFYLKTWPVFNLKNDPMDFKLSR